MAYNENQRVIIKIWVERRIEAHVCICFIAYKVRKELERLIAINKIGMSVDKVLDAAKTITTIKVKMPENGTYFTKTLFLPEKHRAIKPLFGLSGKILGTFEII